MRGFSIAAVLLASASACSAAPVSGIYLSKTFNHVLMIQMVKTPDGHVQGRIEEITLNSDGTLKDDNFPLDGAIDGDQVTLKANELFGMGDTLSGTVDGTTLRLMANNGQNTLIKSDITGVAKAKADLQAAGNNIISSNQRAQAQAQRQSDYQNLATTGQAFEKLPGALAKLENSTDERLASYKQRRDKIAQSIKALKVKWFLTPNEDRGYVEGDIQSQQSDMHALESDFRADETGLSGLFDRIRDTISGFKTQCASAVRTNEPTVPQCANADTFMAEYQISRDKVRINWQSMEQTFATQK